MQTVIVIVIVGVALLMAGRRVVRTLRGKEGCNCANCPMKDAGAGCCCKKDDCGHRQGE